MCNGIIFSFSKTKINGRGFENISPRVLEKILLHGFASFASKVFFVVFFMCIFWGNYILENILRAKALNIILFSPFLIKNGW